ncbi:hypothetical protein ACEPAH_7114 [Sanghuangporus vaninii]
MRDGVVVEVDSVRSGLEDAQINAIGQREVADGAPDVLAGSKSVMTRSQNGTNTDSTPQLDPDHSNVSNTSGQLDVKDGAKPASSDNLDKRLHEGLEEYLQLFFGTTELAKGEDAIWPNAIGWTHCPFNRTCASISSDPLPAGVAADQKEAELSLLYSILYSVLVHLMSMHAEKRQLIRTVRFRISDVCIQRNKKLLELRRMQEKEKESTLNSGSIVGRKN